LPAGSWTDLLTGACWQGGDVLVADVLATFPVALLERTAEPAPSLAVSVKTTR